MSRRVLSATLACCLALSAGLSAHHHHLKNEDLDPYPVVDKITLTNLLAPPPADDSAETHMEIQEMLKIQEQRTDAQAAAAVADHTFDVFRFADVLGPAFNRDSLPLTAALFDRVLDTGKAAVGPAKLHWGRSRPGMVDARVMPLIKEPNSPSYPSDHATAGTLMAIVLADMVPEKAAQLYARGWTFALNRVVAGAHFPSDVQAGRIAGTVVAQMLFQDPEFLADYAAARAELRKALGLGG